MPDNIPTDHGDTRLPEPPPKHQPDRAPRPGDPFETRPSGSSTSNETGTQDGGPGG